MENLRNMALDRYQGQEESLCFLGLALCTKMRIRKRRVSNSMPRSWEPILFKLFVYNVNQDIRGMSGKSANDKMGTASGFQKASAGWGNQAKRARWNQGENIEFSTWFQKNLLNTGEKSWKVVYMITLGQMLQTVGTDVFCLALAVFVKNTKPILKNVESHIKIRISGFSWKTDRSGISRSAFRHDSD